MSSRIAQTIATQARVLRQRKDMSQAEVARKLGTSQNAIYRLENPKYGRPNISTLKKAAAFYDVGLIVRFASFSEIADWTGNLSEVSMDVPDFEHDGGFADLPEESVIGENSGDAGLVRVARGELIPFDSILQLHQGLAKKQPETEMHYSGQPSQTGLTGQAGLQ